MSHTKEEEEIEDYQCMVENLITLSGYLAKRDKDKSTFATQYIYDTYGQHLTDLDFKILTDIHSDIVSGYWANAEKKLHRFMRKHGVEVE